MIGVITTDGIQTRYSLRERIRRGTQGRIFLGPDTKNLRITECSEHGAFVLKSFPSLVSPFQKPTSEESLLGGGFAIDDSKFGCFEVVLLVHGFFCAGAALHNENFDPWGSHSLARLLSSLLNTDGLIGVARKPENMHGDLGAFWPRTEVRAPAAVERAARELSPGDWSFLGLRNQAG
jgi:hypothetical protein